MHEVKVRQHLLVEDALGERQRIDSDLSAEERALVQSFATALNVDAARFEALLGQVRDELIGALSHLPDAESVANVVRELTAGG